MTPAHPRSLADATILQPVSKMRDDPAGHAAVDTALTLLQAGARAIVAGDGGPLVGELRAFGGEWLPMINDTLNPLRIRAMRATCARARACTASTRCAVSSGHCPDMLGALTVADVVVVPAFEPPLGPRGGRGASHGRPMIATAVGMLPENLLWPPRMRDELRIGWVVRPAIPASLRVRSARHCRLALPLTRRWARGRANSPNSCFRRKALLKLSAGCSRATPDRAGSCTSKSCTSRNGSRS